MIGELAALATAFSWSFGSLFFTSGGRQIGALNVNRIRLVFGVLFLGIALLISKGWLIQPGISEENLFFLALSGIIGLVIGDSLLFSAMVLIGTRLTLLIFSLSPAITALFAWIYLGESLELIAILGILITLTGVIWVTREKPSLANNNSAIRISAKGVILAFLGGTGQAVGIVFAKQGMGEMINPLAGTFVRMVFAAGTIWIISLITGSVVRTIKSFENHKGVFYSIGGAFFGPFLGVWMSLLAVKNTKAGIAMAIMSIVPVLVIPWVMIFYKEKVSMRAAIGAVIAVAGVFILFLH